MLVNSHSHIANSLGNWAFSIFCSALISHQNVRKETRAESNCAKRPLGNSGSGLTLCS